MCWIGTDKDTSSKKQEHMFQSVTVVAGTDINPFICLLHHTTSKWFFVTYHEYFFSWKKQSTTHPETPYLACNKQELEKMKYQKVSPLLVQSNTSNSLALGLERRVQILYAVQAWQGSFFRWRKFVFEKYSGHDLWAQIDLVLIIHRLDSQQVGFPNCSAWESV